MTLTYVNFPSGLKKSESEFEPKFVLADATNALPAELSQTKSGRLFIPNDLNDHRI